MSRNQHRHCSSVYGSARSSSPTCITTPFLHISMTMYSESSSGSSSTSIKETRFGWFSFFMMAISSLISSRELFSSDVECRCNGELNPSPAARAPCRRRLALGRRRRLDWARFRRRDFENSLTACISARQREPMPLSSSATRITNMGTRTPPRGPACAWRVGSSHILGHIGPQRGGLLQTTLVQSPASRGTD